MTETLYERQTMLFLTQALLLLFGIKDAVCRKTAETPEVIKVSLGKPLTLDCTYNCSSGFVRGHWKCEDACGNYLWEENHIHSEDMCTVSLTTQNLTLEQTLYNLSCVSEKIDDKHLPLKTERLILLQIQEDKTTAPVDPHIAPSDASLKVVIERNQETEPVEAMWSQSIKVPVGTQLKLICHSTGKQCEKQWIKDQGTLPKASPGPLLQWDKIIDENGGSYTCYAEQHCTSQRITIKIEVTEDDEYVWIKALAAIALSAVITLLILLIYLCYKRKYSSSDSEDSCGVIYENTRTNNEAMVLKPTVQDCQSDHEVPYADIVISVRGSSFPELTGVQNQAPRDQRLRWKEDTSGGSRLHACRSADRLHVHPREVSRKLSTTSEYAVITYSTEGLS